jgi:hypothetical protein
MQKTIAVLFFNAADFLRLVLLAAGFPAARKRQLRIVFEGLESNDLGGRVRHDGASAHETGQKQQQHSPPHSETTYE